jgi:hypothetical protein
MTAAEATAFAALRTGIQAAVPQAMAGYTSAFTAPGDLGPFVPASVAPDGMVRMAFTATQTLDQGVRDERQQNLYADRARGTPEQQARLADLRARDEALHRARDKARDRAEKDRLRAEMKAVQAEENALLDQIASAYQAWVASGGAAAAQQGLEKALPPGRLGARFLVNADLSVDDRATAYALPGFPLAFEQREGCQDPGSSCITVLIGSFEKEKRVSGYTRYAPRRPRPGVSTKARTIALVVSGPGDRPESARAFLGRVNLARLAELVKE